MQINRAIILALIFFLNIHLSAQSVGERMTVPIHKTDGTAYLHLGLGGMNNPQFSEIDLNNDGIMDLFVLDKTGDVILTFINDGIPNEMSYQFAPEYIDIFPETVKEWALLRDYNGDGLMDIFCYSSTPGIAGVELYKGSYIDNQLSFDLVPNHHNNYDLLSFPSFNGLELSIYVSRDDLPSIVDVDLDGDIDILTFNTTGNKMEWYRNLSIEMGYGTDSLYFELADNCWGQFVESETSFTIDMSTNPNQCADLNLRLSENNALVHVGSTSVCWDNDGDGDMELIVGDVTTNSLSYLNSSTVNDDETPWLDILEENFPFYDTPVKVLNFPSPFILDLNNDGKKDFIAAPNDVGVSFNQKVAWRYENYATSGEGLFGFVEDDFLVGDGVDLGQGSKPAFFDYNADGLMDIVVGTDGYYNDLVQFDTRLVLFENIGTTSTPSYQLVDEDWLGFSQYVDRNLAPAFGDLDSDGDLDLLVGERNGSLFYAENTGGSGIPVFNQIIPSYLNIEAGQKCVPSIGDLDNDGLADITTGITQGRLSFFKNIGTVGNPNFNPDRSESPNIDGLGGVDVRFYYSSGVVDTRGYAAPKLFYVDGMDPHFITGSYFNKIFVHNGITGNLESTFTIDAENYGDIYEGQETAPDMADIDNDGYFEMVVGNARGGLAFYETDYIADMTIDVEETISKSLDYDIIPNPTRNQVTFLYDNVDANIEIGLMDTTGRWLKNMREGRTIELDNLPQGVYFLIVNIDNQQILEKVIKY